MIVRMNQVRNSPLSIKAVVLLWYYSRHLDDNQSDPSTIQQGDHHRLQDSKDIHFRIVLRY